MRRAALLAVLALVACDHSGVVGADAGLPGDDAGGKASDAGAPDDAGGMGTPDLQSCHDTLAVFCASHPCRSYTDELAFAKANRQTVCAWQGGCFGYLYIAYSGGFSGSVYVYDAGMKRVGVMLLSDEGSDCGGFALRYGDVPAGFGDPLAGFGVCPGDNGFNPPCF